MKSTKYSKYVPVYSSCFSVFLLLVVFVQFAAPVFAQKRKDTINVAGFNYKLPPWWETVKVNLPEHLQTPREVEAFVAKRYGRDTGTKRTWKKALKTYAFAYQKMNVLPVYLAHCHVSGGEYARGARIYAALYGLTETQGDKKHWYRVYLAYNAGHKYAMSGDYVNAKRWYLRSAKYLNYVGPHQKAITYYAKRSVNALKRPNLLPLN